MNVYRDCILIRKCKVYNKSFWLHIYKKMTKIEEQDNINSENKYSTEEYKDVTPEYVVSATGHQPIQHSLSWPLSSAEQLNLNNNVFIIRKCMSEGTGINERMDLINNDENTDIPNKELHNKVLMVRNQESLAKTKRKEQDNCTINSWENSYNRIMTTDVKRVLNLSFNDFNLKAEILLALLEKGWKWPSPIQETAIPKIMKGNNLIARSKNGTGKTGTYAISLLNNIDVNRHVQVIILVPTRELALQTANVCISIAKYLDGLNVMVATGGTNLTEDIYRLNNDKYPIQVVVATPKRILDLIHSNQFSPENVESVVFDEADKLLSTDFQDIIDRLIDELPRNCQKLLFSATFPVSLKYFINKYMIDCEMCNLMNELTLKGVTQYYAYVKEDQKVSCLRLLLDTLEVKQSIIFCNSTKRVELLARKIIDMGFSCFYIHSKLDQLSRNKAFHDFRVGYIKHLVCTDIMTRGIDIPVINVVFNFDFPKYAESYLHRIGRCGRFGHLAIAINFITDYDKDHFLDVEKQIDTKITAIPREIDKRLYVPSFQLKDKFEKMSE